MFDVSNNNIITITRGDTATLSMYINIGSELEPLYFPLTDTDAKVYMGIMEPHQPFEKAIVKKTFDKDHGWDPEQQVLLITIRPEDTERLIPGVYYYSIKLYRPASDILGQDQIDTIIPKRKFVIVD